MSDLHRFTSEPGADVQQVAPAKPKRTHRIEWSYLLICLAFLLMGGILAHLIGW